MSPLFVLQLYPQYPRKSRILCYNLSMAGKKTASTRNDSRPNGKASKKHPKMFDPQKRRLVSL